MGSRRTNIFYDHNDWSDWSEKDCLHYDPTENRLSVELVFFLFSFCQLVHFWFHNWAKHIEKTVVQCLWRRWGDVHWQQEWRFVRGHFTSFQLQLQTSKGKHLVSENWSFYDIFTPCSSRKAIDRPMTNKWFWIKLTDGSPGRVCAPRFRPS